jgi:hypothetical protein
MTHERHMHRLSNAWHATSRRHVLMDFTYNHIDPTSQPHSISDVMQTSPDFGAKKIHKIHHACDPDPGF